MKKDVKQLKSEIRDWWASAPMTYAEDHGATLYHLPDGTVERVEIGSRRFFELADQTFYRWNEPLRGEEGPFGRIFDYRRYRGMPVLEIGCGMGCMAMNWAQRGARVTAVDLNPVAAAQTRRRFELFGLTGDIREVDGETLPFDDASFQFAYSWGVLHHTPGIAKAIAELFRVLAPGGQIGLMLYNRNSILYRYSIAFEEGVVNGERLFLDELELASRYGDGAREEGNPHTWPVTEREVRRDLMPMFEEVDIRVFGTDVPDLLNTWYPRLSKFMTSGMIKAVGRRWGWSLWITGRKPA
jgi:SAM-dependent methyltransferase